MSDGPAHKLIERLKTEARLNSAFEDLAATSTAVYAVPYINWIKKPRYNLDEGMWLKYAKKKVEPVCFGIVRLGPANRNQLTARVQVDGPPLN